MHKPRLNRNNAYRADPTLARFGIRPIGLLHGEFNTALHDGVGQRHFQK
jgi:hypothetical protein